MPDITNPHDRFFKEAFSRPEVAEDFVVNFLPAAAGLLQPKTFRLRKGSFVDAGLNEYHTDLLYQVDFKDGSAGFVCFLFEHKSSPAPGIALQLLQYMARIWAVAAKETGGSLPPVIPVVVYNGTAKWNIPLNFASLYRAPDGFKDGLWDFTYHLCDLSSYADHEIRMGAMTTLALLLLKHIRDGDLGDRLEPIFRLLLEMNEQTALQFLEAIMAYLGARPSSVTVEQCRKAVAATFPETGEMNMERWTEQLVAERKEEWLQEGILVGMQKGIQEGMQKGMKEGMQTGIKEGMQKGMKEGMQTGIKEGMQTGIKEGMTSFTIRLLLRKFQSLDSELENRVRRLSREELEALGDDLLDIPNEEALTEWLDRRTKTH